MTETTFGGDDAIILADLVVGALHHLALAST